MALYYLLRIKEDGSYIVSPESDLIFEESRRLSISDEVRVMWKHTYKKAGKRKDRLREYTGTILDIGHDKEVLYKEQDKCVARAEEEIQQKEREKDEKSRKQQMKKDLGETSSSETASSGEEDSSHSSHPSSLGRGFRDKAKKRFYGDSFHASDSTNQQVNQPKKLKPPAMPPSAEQLLALQSAHIKELEHLKLSTVPAHSPSKEDLKKKLEFLEMKASMLSQHNAQMSAALGSSSRKKHKKSKTKQDYSHGSQMVDEKRDLLKVVFGEEEKEQLRKLAPNTEGNLEPVKVASTTEEKLEPVKVTPTTEEKLEPVKVATTTEEKLKPVKVATTTEEKLKPVKVATTTQEKLEPLKVILQTPSVGSSRSPDFRDSTGLASSSRKERELEDDFVSDHDSDYTFENLWNESKKEKKQRRTKKCTNQKEISTEEKTESDDGEGAAKKNKIKTEKKSFAGEMFRFEASDSEVTDLGEGIFCSKKTVENLKNCATHTQVARDLLTSVFSDDALLNCSLKGGNSGKAREVRPGLNQKAILVITTYAKLYAERHFLRVTEKQKLEKNLNTKLSELRSQEKKKLNA